jgi:hypothetical protein
MFPGSKGKYHRIIIAGLQSRYFTDTANLINNGF